MGLADQIGARLDQKRGDPPSSYTAALAPRGSIEIIPHARTPFGRSDPELIERLPDTVNLRIYGGDDIGFSISVYDEHGQDADLTGATVRAQIRTTVEAEEVAGEFDPDLDGNVIRMHLTNSTTAALPRSTVWDCELTDSSGWVTTLVAGEIDTTPSVTR
jgi:hypothetical protein